MVATTACNSGQSWALVIDPRTPRDKTQTSRPAVAATIVQSPWTTNREYSNPQAGSVTPAAGSMKNQVKTASMRIMLAVYIPQAHPKWAAISGAM